MRLTKMMKCEQPSCHVKVRHYWEDKLVDGQFVYGWKCGNCSHWQPSKDRRRKGAAGKTVFDRVISKLEADDEFMGQKGWKGYVTFAELKEMSEHHSLREWSVHSEFGIIPVPKQKLFWYFRDDSYKVRSAERLAEKTGRPVEGEVHIRRKENRSGFTYKVTVVDVRAYVDDERKSYYPL